MPSRSRWLLCCCNLNTTREGQLVRCASYSASYFSHTAWLHQRVLCKSYSPNIEAVTDSCHRQLFHGRTLPSCRAGIRFQHNLSVGSVVCMCRSASTDIFATQLSGASIPPGHSRKTVQTPTASTHCEPLQRTRGGSSQTFRFKFGPLTTSQTGLAQCLGTMQGSIYTKDQKLQGMLYYNEQLSAVKKVACS